MNDELKNTNGRQLNDAYRVAYLVAGYIRHTLTDPERDELDEWVTASQDNMRLFAELTDEKNIERGLKERGMYDADKAVQQLRKKLRRTKRQVPARKVRMYAYGIAACFIILIGVFFLYKILRDRKPQKAIVEKTDLAPGGDKAILTLSNGKKIILDSIRGNILQQGDLKLVNENGRLSYEGKTQEIEYHTLTTLRGGQYKIILPDGTAVWLNAASSLKYPTAFAGVERLVELNGEGYFEVTKDKTKPFKVKLKNDAIVEVLGTHFNIMAYDDEQGTRTTLLEGTVKLIQSSSSVMISPGEQAEINKDGKITLNKNVDTEEIIAWKNGMFEFHDEPIDEIMRQVARWYDVDIKYEAQPMDHFNATISRNVPVSKLFHWLESTDRVHFTIQDKTIIVKP
jgi:transmembrane sensor